jgi:hypothetical protein
MAKQEPGYGPDNPHHLSKFGPAPRQQIDEFLIPKLPDILKPESKIHKIKNLLTEMRTQGRSFGLGAAGVIMLLPLSPKLLCLGYDGDVYRVRHDRGMIDVRRGCDIASFNQHQILNCCANLVVKDAEHYRVVHESFAEAAKNRPKNRYITTPMRCVIAQKGNTRDIALSTQEYVRVTLKHYFTLGRFIQSHSRGQAK